MTDDADLTRFQAAWPNLSPELRRALSDIVEGLHNGTMDQSAAMTQLAALNTQV